MELDKIYSERNVLAIAFCKLAINLGWNAGKRMDEGHPNWEDEWKHVITVDIPGNGQVSWHMSPSELELIKDLPEYNGEWDGTYVARGRNWSNLIEIKKEANNG